MKNVTGADLVAGLKTTVDKLDVDQLKSVPNGLSILKSKVKKIDVDKSETVSNDLTN